MKPFNVMTTLRRSKFVRDTLALQLGKFGVTGLSILSSVLVFRLLQAEAYGTWALVQSFLVVWNSFNLTGVNISTGTRLAIAVGARDENEIVNLLAFYVQVSIGWAVAITAALALLGPLVARLVYEGDPHIGVLAFWLSFTELPDALYSMVTISLQSRRNMRTLAVLQNVNQLVLVLCVLAALAISPTPEGMIVSRLVYSIVTMLIALAVYERLRPQDVVFPPLWRVLLHVRRVSPRPYWRFGVLTALDKNISNLFTAVPLQVVGVLTGSASAGYLDLALKAMTIPAMLSSALFDNLQAVIPQAVGRGDFGWLWRNFLRILAVLSLSSAGFYAVIAITAPLLVPLVYGAEAVPAVPVIGALVVYGAITTVGGIFGPLYRALSLLRPALLVKLLAFALALLPGLWLIQEAGALGGAWFVNLLFALSVSLTAVSVLRELRHRTVTLPAP